MPLKHLWFIFNPDMFFKKRTHDYAFTQIDTVEVKWANNGFEAFRRKRYIIWSEFQPKETITVTHFRLFWINVKSHIPVS